MVSVCLTLISSVHHIYFHHRTQDFQKLSSRMKTKNVQGLYLPDNGFVLWLRAGFCDKVHDRSIIYERSMASLCKGSLCQGNYQIYLLMTKAKE